MSVDKAWRNPAKAGTRLVLVARPLAVDSEGFLPDLLEPEEVAKLARIPGWRYVDRDGVDVQESRLSQLSKETDELKSKIGVKKVELDDLERRYADKLQQISKIKLAADEASVRAEEEKLRAEKIELARLNMNELRALAAKHGIAFDPRDRNRDKLEAALKPIVETQNQAEEADAKKEGES